MNTYLLSQEYQHSSAEHASSDRWILPIVQHELRDLPFGSVIADLGCGNGAFLSEFRGRGFDLYGLEVSRSGLTQGKAAYPEINFVQADLCAEFLDSKLRGTCDVVISTEVVEHIFSPRTFASNCHRLLKPGGRLVISTPYHGYFKNLTLAVTGRMDAHFTALWDFGHIKFWSVRTLTVLLEEAGFRIDKFRGAGRLPYLWKSMVLVATK